MTNLALNEVRGRGRRRNLLERFGRLATPPRAGPAEDLDRGDAQHQLWDAINSLPESDRTVLYLRHYLELPEAEIAAAIGRRPGTVKSRLSRAAARLRAVIERDYPDLAPGGQANGGFDGPRR